MLQFIWDKMDVLIWVKIFSYLEHKKIILHCNHFFCNWCDPILITIT